MRAVAASSSNMARSSSPASRVARRELLLFGGLLPGGLLLLPPAIYVVGRAVFGDYGGGDLFDFFAAVLARVVSLEPGALFLVLSPYLFVQLVRLAVMVLKGRLRLARR